MAIEFVKLYKSAWTGTFRTLPASTRILFMAMLDLADAEGTVKGTPEFLSLYANIKLEATRISLEKLAEPDPGSTSPYEEGRRIVKTGPNVWRIVNYVAYLQKGTEKGKDRAEYMREYMREYRNGGGPRGGNSDGSNLENGVNSVNRVNPKGKKRKVKQFLAAQVAAEFARLKDSYPERAGDYKWKDALARFDRLINDEGVDPAVIVAGVARYARHCKNEGIVGTSKVKQALSFLNQRTWEEGFTIAPDSPNRPKPVEGVDYWKGAPPISDEERDAGRVSILRMLKIVDGEKTYERFDEDEWRAAL